MFLLENSNPRPKKLLQEVILKAHIGLQKGVQLLQKQS